jgi:hypothetical protein
VTRLTLLEPAGELTGELLRDVLGLVGVTIPAERADGLTPNERLLAYDWALREHLRASDNTSVRARPKPSFLSEP